MNKLTILPTDCDCERCSAMCQAPCCGTPEDVNRLIEAGYGSRLMLDDWPGDAAILKPAMKGSEGEKAPWEVRTLRGCTFWKEGKCELHMLGLKPTQGKLAHHTLTNSQEREIAEIIRHSWDGDNLEKASELIKYWKKTINWVGRYEQISSD